MRSRKRHQMVELAWSYPRDDDGNDGFVRRKMQVVLWSAIGNLCARKASILKLHEMDSEKFEKER